MDGTRVGAYPAAGLASDHHRGAPPTRLSAAPEPRLHSFDLFYAVDTHLGCVWRGEEGEVDGNKSKVRTVL